MARKMTLDGRIAMSSGGLLALIAIVPFIYDGITWAAAIILGLGLLLMLIGKKMS